MTDRAAAEAVVFHRPKAGSTEDEWEDCGGYDRGDGRTARFVVVDGATEAYDAVRWVEQLVSSFLGDRHHDVPPELTPRGMDAWIGDMQQRWADEAPTTFASLFEEHKFHASGSFATFVGCEVVGLDGPQPRWTAISLGDAVLFHVRAARIVAHHPPLAAADFGITPAGLSTQASERDRMRARLSVAGGELRIGDRLFLATDALAEWLIRRDADSGGACWQTLDAVEHPDRFAELVAAERNSGRLKNDDVTMLRVQITPAEADVMVVCR